MPAARKPDWPAVAEALGRAVPRAALDPAAVAWAAGAGPGRWAVACSGGADSLALLLLVWVHWPERRRRLVALHFDHRLRGRASAADARFCEKVGAALGVPVGVGRWDRPPERPGEAEARAARQGFFAAAMRRRRADVLWLGQQQDDVAETLLMRLARGSGTAGLAAPRPVQRQADGRVHVRPLLTVTKRELTEALNAAGATWREDASNATDAFFRNRVRRTVLPAWQAAAGRDVVAGAARARGLLEEDDEALEAWVDRLEAMGADGGLHLERLAGCPRAVWRRALHRWLGRHPHGSDLSSAGFAELLGRCEAGERTRFSLGRHGFAVLARGRLTFERNPASQRPPPRPAAPAAGSVDL